MRKSAFLAVFTLLFIFSFFVLSFSQYPASASSTLRGDIDENGKVDIFDLLELLKTLGNPAGKTDRQKQIADVNASGAVDIFDLLGLLKLVSGAEKPGVIYWGPVITGLSQEGAAAGDTIGIVVENLGENVTAKDIKVYIGMYETAILELSRYTVKIIVPQAFTGGEVKLVIAADTTNTMYLSLMIRKMIVAASGGLVEHPCGASVDVKAGALTTNLQISVSEVSVETAKEQGILEDTCEVPVEFGPSGIIFNQPVTISLPLPSNADSLDLLEAVYYSESKKDWVNLTFIRKDYDKKLLYVETDHFSVMKARKWSIKTGVLQGIALVSIPGGTFQMGTDVTAHPGFEQYTLPVHTVTVSAFQMGRYEVTQAQYQAVIGSNTSFYTGDLNRPVEEVSWYDAVTFCNKLSEAAGLQPCYNLSTWACDFTKNGYRLPTEAEWEYACRAGTTTYYYTGDTESDLARAGWYRANCGGTTHAVGGLEANAFGLYDMHGNVAEWCNDWWTDYYTANSENNPTGPNTGSYRVQRGIGWDNDAPAFGSAIHFHSSPDQRGDICGFRVVQRGAAPATYSLQGSVQERGSGLTGVSVKITGNGVDITLTTVSGGSYSISGLADGTYTVTPAKIGYTFSPASTQVTVSGSDVTAGGITATASGGTTVVQGITFVSIPGGTFQMGSTTGNSNEQPVHQVTVSAFQMSAKEITNSQYAAYLNTALAAGEITATTSRVTGATGDYSGHMYINLEFSGFNNKCWISFNSTSFNVATGKENWPVVNMTWYGSKAFALKYGFDLPREAEWEYAARGGRGYEYGTDDGTLSCAKANYADCDTLRHPVDVCSYLANPFGLYDMAGNVWEWCNDWKGEYSSDNATDPQGPSSGSTGVLRGGAWSPDLIDCRSAVRLCLPRDNGYCAMGFRVVRR